MSKRTQAQAAPPVPPEQTLSLAWQAYSEGRFAEAEKACATVVKVAESHAHAWYLRALAALALNKPKVALQHLAHVKDAPELLPGLAQARGRAFLALGRAEDALASFQETLGYKADDAATHHLLALAFLAKGDAAAARQYFKRTTLLDPELGAAHYELGVLALAAGDARQAVTAFTVAAQRMPTVAQVFNNLALAQQALEDTPQAEVNLRKAIALDAQYAEAWFNLGLLLAARGDAPQAAQARATAVSLNPALAAVQSA